MLLLPVGHFAPQAAATAPLLLDKLTATPAGAWSLRKLRSAYTGPCIRVRRDSDNAEADIGFDGSGSLDVGALLAFVGSGSGYVSKWYDQSGGGFDAAQPTASMQPSSVLSGSCNTLPNATARPTLKFPPAGTNGGFTANLTLAGSQLALFCVLENPDLSGSVRRVMTYNAGTDTSGGQNIVPLIAQNGQIKGYYAGFTSVQTLSTTPAQIASVWNGTNHVMTVDGNAASAVASVPAVVAQPFHLGGGNTNSFQGPIAEVLLFGALGAGDQAAIRSDQKTFYGTP